MARSVPFYLMWLVLSISFLKEDRKRAKAFLFMLCGLLFVWELVLQTQYDTPDPSQEATIYSRVIEMLWLVFPHHWTLCKIVSVSSFTFLRCVSFECSTPTSLS